MTKVRRVCVSFVPYVLSLASLACLAIVCVSCTRKTADIDNLYFFRVDFSNFTTLSESKTSSDHDLNSTTLEYLSTALYQTRKDGDLKDFYSIGLWSYCEGIISDEGSYHTTHCSSPHPKFWFDPLEVWRLNRTTDGDAQLPSHLTKPLRVYKGASLWMSSAYIIAIAVTALELLLGILSIFSRWGSCVTSLVSAVACLFTIAGTVTATVIFSLVKGAFATVLRDLDITTALGVRVLVASWAAVLCSLGAMVFWTVTMYCYSGRSGGASRPPVAHGPNYAYHGVQPPLPMDVMREQPRFMPVSASPYPMQPMQQTSYGPQSSGYAYR
ncbi:SUR7/PalI family-domain-containing protein [Aspergillus pseudoustus]|uniref:SUR7/PalI family-domain-containing protein n=1 Tax=Aspergillus pseudoustus TaxID=1810923 RepID=A0ABR4JXK6_9EURO